jgi:patatin-related protein
LREKELRLAVVCFGGVSLAVYMHGISKELLKLVRASKALHGIDDRVARAQSGFFDNADRDDTEFDTEEVYFDLLREIGADVELRVIVDVIAGASAGGINGVMLARALAHDLPMEGLREMWLGNADVTRLLGDDARARRWSKWILKPLVWGAARMGRFRAALEQEVRHKVSMFVRSRWFRPPFDGLRMSEMLYDAIAGMGSPVDAQASLLPVGHGLECFVTLTDFFGYEQHVPIHSPPLIREREHRHVLRFGYHRWPNGEVHSDFRPEDIPALTFAARATSAFPGAFPPAQLREIDQLAARKGHAWQGREAFIERGFARYRHAGVDPMATSFIDGSVLNNKPFAAAIRAIKGRPAYRQVDRRLLYIDPDPHGPPPPPHGRPPGFFNTIKGALSDIPRNEPVADELAWVAGFNERIRRLAAVIDGARPAIARMVGELPEANFKTALDPAAVRAWREAANLHAASAAGFAYESYLGLKLASVRGFVAQVIRGLCDVPEDSMATRAIGDIIERWAARRGIAFGGGEAGRGETTSRESAPGWLRFLLAFDVEFRKRRLQFLIRGQNRLYQMVGERGAGDRTARLVDRLKREFYGSLDSLRRFDRPEFFAADTRAAARALFADVTAADMAPTAEQADAFLDGQGQGLDALIDQLAAEIDLPSATDDADALLAAMGVAEWDPESRAEVLVNYIGFPFWDVLTLPIVSWRDLGEFDQIRIDRISPEDSRAIRASGAAGTLKGINFAHFGAFFSRAWRENDYLWGRLHAADRMIDIVCDAAGYDPERTPIDVVRLKKRAFGIILDAEERHLHNCADLIAGLREEIAFIGDGPMPGKAKDPVGNKVPA